MKYKSENSAGGIVYKMEGDQVLWLITQHSQHKGWGFPKGLIGDDKKNETMEEAAIREVEEEGGIQAKIVFKDPVKVSYKYMQDDLMVDKTVRYFLMQYLSGDPQNHDWEVLEARFVAEDKVRTTLSFQTDKDAFEIILKLFQN